MGWLKPQMNPRFRRAQKPSHRTLRVEPTPRPALSTPWLRCLSIRSIPPVLRDLAAVFFFLFRHVVGGGEQRWAGEGLVVLQHLPGCERCRRCARRLSCVSGVAQGMETTSSCMITSLIMLGHVVGPLWFAQRQTIGTLCMLFCIMRLAATA